MTADRDERLPQAADLGVLAPLDATTGEAIGIIAVTARREWALGRLLSRRERLLVLADVCGEVACPPIRSRVCVAVLEAVRERSLSSGCKGRRIGQQAQV